MNESDRAAFADADAELMDLAEEAEIDPETLDSIEQEWQFGDKELAARRLADASRETYTEKEARRLLAANYP